MTADDAGLGGAVRDGGDGIGPRTRTRVGVGPPPRGRIRRRGEVTVVRARWAVVAAGVMVASPAWATWSIVAVDPDTREVGAAGATCGPMVWMIGRVEPDVGAAVSLCATRLSARKDLTAALAIGEPPEDALAPLLRPGDDADLGIRQYAVAALTGPSAVFTGDECDAWKGAFAGETFAAAGNTLASEDVLNDVVATYEASEGLPLAERLLAALEAGAAQGGDSRCDPEVAAESAFLSVATPGDGRRPSTDLTGAGRGGAVAELRARFDAGRDRSFHVQCSAASGAASLPLGLAGLLSLGLRRRR